MAEKKSAQILRQKTVFKNQLQFYELIGSVTRSDPPSSKGTKGMRECRTSVISGL
jgi:hypothetical protein